ncbi:MAG: hypothetical protein LBM69_06620 [Lachnospiraceae bacterium]|jgi:uncharacterized membrane protein|nr:hypothetical protein [Lachnospiraceae bacterium]
MTSIWHKSFHTKAKKGLLTNFVLCGMIGWALEICYTALLSLRDRKLTMKGTTSLWMFPIYGCASFFTPLCKVLSKRSILFRGLTYTTLMFGTEYTAGKLLAKKGVCPWDYDRSRWHINPFIRLDFIPQWFLAGLLFERFLCPHTSKRKSRTKGRS